MAPLLGGLSGGVFKSDLVSDREVMVLAALNVANLGQSFHLSTFVLGSGLVIASPFFPFLLGSLFQILVLRRPLWVQPACL